MSGLTIVGALVALAVLWAILVYNALVKTRQKVDEAWSGVDVQLQRRHDLVPNLVEAVRGYAAHERDTLVAVTEARSRALRAQGPREAGTAESSLSTRLENLFGLAEDYPTLRAAENFLRLQAELSEIEDEIQAARRIYNANVQHLNTSVQVFPNLLIAQAFSFLPRDFFEVHLPEHHEAPQVSV